jgi:hypothetical protein
LTFARYLISTLPKRKKIFLLFFAFSFFGKWSHGGAVGFGGQLVAVRNNAIAIGYNFQ